MQTCQDIANLNKIFALPEPKAEFFLELIIIQFKYLNKISEVTD
jgi:hypothetical protein